MRHFVEGFGKVKQDCVNLGLVVHSSHPVVDYLNELRFTRQSRLESVLEACDQPPSVNSFKLKDKAKLLFHSQALAHGQYNAKQ